MLWNAAVSALENFMTESEGERKEKKERGP